MRCPVALLATVTSVSILHAGAYRPLKLPLETTLQRTDTWPPTPQAKRANLTAILTLDGPFRTFLGYLQETNLVEVFQNQAYLTDQGITIFVPVDTAFAAVKPSVLSGLSRHQLKNLMMYHSLAKHYELADLEGLSRIGPPPPTSDEDAGALATTEPEPVAPRQDDSAGVADAPVSACGAGDRFVRYAAIAALGAVALVAL